MDSASLPPLIRNQDEEHLKLLAIFHYIVAAIIALFACFPLIHVAMGWMMVANPGFMANGQQGQPPPAAFGYVVIAMGALLILMGWAAAICTFVSGRFLARRRNRLFSFVMAALLCMFMPFGTILGIFTIVVLSKESVQRLYRTTPVTP